MSATPTPIHVVAALLYNHAGEVLVSQRPAGKAFAGRWEFPGGKVEAGETAGAALVRELREELNLDLAGQIFQHCHREERDGLLLDFYRCQPREALRPEAREGQRWQWLPPAELATLDFLDSNRALLAQLREPR